MSKFHPLNKDTHENTINFRWAAADDREAVLQMMAHFYAIDKYPFDLEKSTRNFNILISNPQVGRLWLVTDSEQIIGYVFLAFGFSFEYGGRNAFIDELYLIPECRNKGIGKRVLAFVEEQAIELGIQTLHLEVEKHNENGQRLYSGRGFKDTGRYLFAKRL